MSYLIKTDHFGITLTHVHLLRSGFSYKAIPIELIHQVSIEKGIRIKHPIRSTIFGVVLIALSLYCLSKYFMFNILEPGYSENMAYKLVWGWLMVIGFFLTMGVISLIWALKRTIILKVRTNDGVVEVFDLRGLIKKNLLGELDKLNRQLFTSRYALRVQVNLATDFRDPIPR